MSKLYIAVYVTSKTHRYHVGFVISGDQDNLAEPVEIHQIIQNGGTWYNGYSPNLLLVNSSESSRFVCCIRLPLSGDTNDVSTLLKLQAVNQDTTQLPPDMLWSCGQWLLRSLEELVREELIPNTFSIGHKMWKELIMVDITKTADEAVTNPDAGSINNGVRVLDLPQSYYP